MASVDDLSESGQIAHRAFLDMRDSKAAHFKCLEAMEELRDAGGVPSLAENLELEKLLKAHDHNVMAFKTAFDAVTDDAERELLMQLLT